MIRSTLDRLDGRTREYRSSMLGRDPYFSSVVCLLDFEGNNAQTGLSDATGRAWTTVSNAQLSTARSRWGRSSGLFDGAQDAWTTPDTSDLNLTAASSYTIEASIYNTATTAGNQVIVGKDGRFGVSYPSYFMFINSAGKFGFQIGSGTGTTASQVFTSASPALSLNTWHDLAIVKSSGNILMFIDGQLDSTTAITITPVNGNFTGLYLGNYHSNSATNDMFNGNMDAIRITSGVARYTGNYAPRPFPRG